MVHDCIFVCLGVLFTLTELANLLSIRSKPNTALREKVCTFCKIDDLKPDGTARNRTP